MSSRRVKILSFRIWLLAVLVAVGQHGGVLHHLGHDFDSLRLVVALADAGTDRYDGQPESRDDKHGVCILCIGFGGGAVAQDASGANFAVTATGFIRPIAASPRLRSLFLRGAPIRGPPASFSRLA